MAMEKNKLFLILYQLSLRFSSWPKVLLFYSLSYISDINFLY